MKDAIRERFEKAIKANKGSEQAARTEHHRIQECPSLHRILFGPLVFGYGLAGNVSDDDIRFAAQFNRRGSGGRVLSALWPSDAYSPRPAAG